MGKTYKNTGEGKIRVGVQGRGTMITLGPGESYEAQSEAEEEAFEGNPDVESSGGDDKAEQREAKADKAKK